MNHSDLRQLLLVSKPVNEAVSTSNLLPNSESCDASTLLANIVFAQFCLCRRLLLGSCISSLRRRPQRPFLEATRTAKRMDPGRPCNAGLRGRASGAGTWRASPSTWRRRSKPCSPRSRCKYMTSSQAFSFDFSSPVYLVVSGCKVQCFL